MFKNLEWLWMPEIRDLTDLDDPQTVEIHRRIIQSKPILKDIYRSWYHRMAASIPQDKPFPRIIEIGSGAGFIKRIIPRIFTSDSILSSQIDICFSATALPFTSGSLDAIFMMDVLHHIARPADFFQEAVRCLKTGGRIVMIEPSNSSWARFVYRHFHAEPFEPNAGWELKKGGRLTSANGALPWILFCRDRERFERSFPQLRILDISLHNPFLYLISGGLSFRQLSPSFTLPVWKMLEKITMPFHKYLGMFMTVCLVKDA